MDTPPPITETFYVMPPSSLSISSSSWFCIFCLKNESKHSSLNKTEDKSNSLLQQRFFEMLQKHFEEKRIIAGGTETPKVDFSFTKEAEKLQVVSCDECFSVIVRFIQIYDKVKCLQMQLDYNLVRLKQAMTSAEEDVAKVCAFQDWCLLNDKRVEESMEFRRRFQNQCESSSLSDFPHISLIKTSLEPSPKKLYTENEPTHRDGDDCQEDFHPTIKQEYPHDDSFASDVEASFDDDLDHNKVSDPDWFENDLVIPDHRKRDKRKRSTKLQSKLDNENKLSYTDHCQVELAIAMEDNSNESFKVDDDDRDPLDDYSDDDTDSDWLENKNFSDDDQIGKGRKRKGKITEKSRPKKAAKTKAKKRIRIRKKKSKISPNNAIKTISCQKCQVEPRPAFVSVNALQVHQKYLHTNGYVTLTKTENSEVLRLEEKDLKLHGFRTTVNCCSKYFPKCDQKFWSADELNNHLKYHVDITCETCGIVKSNAIDMVHHELSHLNNPNDGISELESRTIMTSCGKCEYSSALEGDLINHYLEFHLNKPAIQATCPICKFQFKYLDKVPVLHYLNYHDLTRLEDPLSTGIQCVEDGCPAYFLTEDQLQQHWNCTHAKESNTLKAIIAGERKSRKEAIKSKRKLMRRKGRECIHACEFCEKAFRTENELKDHTWRYHCDKKWGDSCGKIQLTEDGLTIDEFASGSKCVCRICENVFGSKEQLDRHELHHGKFRCTFCSVVKTLATELTIHETVHNIGQDDVSVAADIFKCPRCSFTTRKRPDYIDHHLESHLGLPSDRKRCPICKKSVPDLFKMKTGLAGKAQRNWMVGHYMELHDKTGLKSDTMPKCHLCPGYFRTAIQLDNHLRDIHGIQNFPCWDCTEIFDKREKLKRHRVKVHNVDPLLFQFVCSFPECGCRFETQVELEYHEVGAHNEGNLCVQVCSECGKVCSGISQLKAHMKVHDRIEKQVEKKSKKTKKESSQSVDPSQESLVCEQCGKSYRTRDNLMAHRRRHRGPEVFNFVCSVCSKRCPTNYKLAQHMRSHTKEKPFSCSVCGATFGFSQNLRSHMNNKHKDVDIKVQKVQ